MKKSFIVSNIGKFYSILRPTILSKLYMKIQNYIWIIYVKSKIRKRTMFTAHTIKNLVNFCIIYINIWNEHVTVRANIRRISVGFTFQFWIFSFYQIHIQAYNFKSPLRNFVLVFIRKYTLVFQRVIIICCCKLQLVCSSTHCIAFSRNMCLLIEARINDRPGIPPWLRSTGRKRKMPINRPCNIAINMYYVDDAMFDKLLHANHVAESGSISR